MSEVQHRSNLVVNQCSFPVYTETWDTCPQKKSFRSKGQRMLSPEIETSKILNHTEGIITVQK